MHEQYQLRALSVSDMSLAEMFPRVTITTCKIENPRDVSVQPRTRIRRDYRKFIGAHIRRICRNIVYVGAVNDAIKRCEHIPKIAERIENN